MENQSMRKPQSLLLVSRQSSHGQVTAHHPDRLVGSSPSLTSF